VAQPIEDRGQLAISDLLQRRGRFCQRRLDPIWHNADPLAIILRAVNISACWFMNPERLDRSMILKD
jgi:hypothetical protein